MNYNRNLTIRDILLENERTIKLEGEVNEASAAAVVDQLLYLDSKSNTKPIILMINSPGGSVYHGRAILDAIDYVDAPVHAIVMGIAMSMAAIIFSHCEKGHRLITPLSTVMLHQVSSGVEGNIQDMRVSLAETERVNKDSIKLLADNTGHTYDEMENICSRDKYLSAHDAVEFGIADGIFNKSNKLRSTSSFKLFDN